MEGMDTLDAAFDASTLPSKKKEPGTQIASRLSLVVANVDNGFESH